MIRRPRHQAGVSSANYAFSKREIQPGLSYVGKRRDYWKYPYFSFMNPYYKLDLAASWWIIEQLQAIFPYRKPVK